MSTPRPPGRVAAWLALASAALLAPFLTKPFHIDDTLFVKLAAQCARAPHDFFGTTVNWYGIEQHFADVMKNPPLMGHLLAVPYRLFGPSEVALHVVGLGFAVAAVLATRRLACALGLAAEQATLAAALLLAFPAFLVSATTVMCDVPMVALVTAAAALWVEGVEGPHPRKRWLAGLLLGLALLTKYFAVAFIALFAVYALARRARPSAHVALLVPVGLLVGYELWTAHLYGYAHFLDALGYAGRTRETSASTPAEQALVGLSFAGASFLPLLWLLHRRWLAAAAVLVLLGVAGAVAVGGFAGHLRGLALGGPGSGGFDASAQIGLACAAGILVVALPLAALLRRRDAPALLLALWIGGTFVFAAFVNWTCNVRSILPAGPPLALLLAGLSPSAAGPRRAWVGAAFGILLGLAVGHADLRQAHAEREGARWAAALRTTEDRDVWFSGHWGFQHYMETRGARPVALGSTVMEPGDVYVVDLGGTATFGVTGERVEPLPGFDVPVAPFLATMDVRLGAGFYSDLWGPLPYVFGRTTPRRFGASVVVRQWGFPSLPR